jgi:hypothetical protein
VNAVWPRKSRALSRLEGMALTAVFQAFPTFTAAALLVKLSGASDMTNHGGSVVTFIVLAMLFHSLVVSWLGPRFPRFFQSSYEPLFYDATLSLREKIARWRVQPVASRQLLTTVMMLSLLAVAAMSVG